MKFETISPDFRRIEGWTPSVDSLVAAAEGFAVSKPEEMRPCGCGVKLDLQDVVYPALESSGTAVDLARVDAHSQPGRFRDSCRVVVDFSELAARREEIASRMAEFRPGSVIELLTTGRNYFADREGTKNEFSSVTAEKFRLLTEIGGGLRFGKGHSIGAGGNFLLMDFLRYQAGPGYTVSNNDTIITADSLLQHHCAISVFTALNNALNDLFLLGVNEQLRIFPVYDGNPSEVAQIRAAFAAYQKFYADRGVSIAIEDSGPLNRGVQLNGATVLGSAQHELPSMAGLQPGQVILATRFFGDLSVLSQHRGAYFSGGASVALRNLRWGALQRFTTPNFLLANLIRSYLPTLGEAFDANRHLGFSTDCSGPGISVLEEGARASGVNVFVEDLRFIDEGSLKFYRKNQTSSTNGPILLAAAPAVAEKISADLARLGLNEVWRVGKVLEHSAQPTMLLHPSLRDRYRSTDPRTDLFAPEVRYGSGDELSERVPIFQRYEFANRS